MHRTSVRGGSCGACNCIVWTLGFNFSLMREMRAINFVNRLVDSGFDRGG